MKFLLIRIDASIAAAAVHAAAIEFMMAFPELKVRSKYCLTDSDAPGPLAAPRSPKTALTISHALLGLASTTS